MTTVWKYPIPSYKSTISMPIDSRILSVQLQNDQLMMWVLVDTENPVTERHFEIYGTGHEIPPDRAHIATYQDGPFVWHLFKRI